MHVPSLVVAEESEEIGVEHLLRDIRDTTTVGTLSTRVGAQLSSLRGLQARLLEIRDYLQLVAEGKLAVNHQIIYNLQDIFNLLPDLDAGEASLKRAFSVASNDQMLVTYLASLIRAVSVWRSLDSSTFRRLTAPLCPPTGTGTSRSRAKQSGQRQGRGARRGQEGECREGQEGRCQGWQRCKGRKGCQEVEACQEFQALSRCGKVCAMNQAWY